MLLSYLLAAAANENDNAEKNVAFKSNAPLRLCISIINNILMDNVEDLDIVMPMHNLLEYSQNNCMTSRNLWSCYRDEIDNTNDHLTI